MIKTVDQVQEELTAWEKTQTAAFETAAALHAKANTIHASGVAINDTIRVLRAELMVARGETA